LSGNDLVFVRETMGLLDDAGILAWLLGGWAEELLGLAPPRPHPAWHDEIHAAAEACTPKMH
jgi:hypothetical protein